MGPSFMEIHGTPASETAKILVVDDDIFIRSFMEAALRTGGYSCRCAEDGVVALALLEKDMFDIVISDIEMPRLNGFQLLSEIRSRYPATKTLMISGRPQPMETGGAASRHGADFFFGQALSVDALAFHR